LGRIRVVLRRLPFFGRGGSSGVAGLVAATARGGFPSRWLDSFHGGQIQQPWGQICAVPVCCAEVGERVVRGSFTGIAVQRWCDGRKVVP